MKGESRAYHVWSENEEQALREGVKRYGVGSWEPIRQDKSFSVLKHRSGVQLKDKWRNLVKFRKLDGRELQNLPRRATGPWSKKSETTRMQRNYDPHSHADVRRGGSRCEDRRFGIYDFRRYSRGVLSEESDASTHEVESAVVACPCGVDFDDGQQMIECEECKEWAHTTCLQALMDRTESDHYVCPKCERKHVFLSFQTKGHRSKYRKRRQRFDELSETISSFQKSTGPGPILPPFGGMSVTTAACMLTELLKVTCGTGSGCDSEKSLASQESHVDGSDHAIHKHKRKQPDSC